MKIDFLVFNVEFSLSVKVYASLVLKATIRWLWVSFAKNLIITVYFYPHVRIGNLLNRLPNFLISYEPPFIGLAFIYCMVNNAVLEAVKIFGRLAQSL